ncbi:MAG TPA: ABC transporter permease [Thermoanaerobaculia bacterium]|nr:ABC transporter permease [Thermoanaerobaculia bacterium]
MSTMLREFRIGFRRLMKDKVFSGIALVTLGLGIGANSAIFTVMDWVLLRPLPYTDSDRLVMLYQTHPTTFENTPAAFPNIMDWRSENKVFEDVAAFQAEHFSLTGVDQPEYLKGAYVSAGLFPLLGAEAWRGRTFLTDEDLPGAAPVAVVSAKLWNRYFGSSRDLRSQSLILDGVSYQVVGVMRPSFRMPGDLRLDEGTDVWLPIAPMAHEKSRRMRQFSALARLKEGVSLAAARSDLTAVAARLAKEYPEANEGRSAAVVPLRDYVVKDVRPRLVLLAVIVVLVLLIACANVANQLLSQAISRSREMSIRSILGAGRVQLLRQLVIESLILAIAAGGLGLLIATWAVQALRLVHREQLPRVDEIVIDGRVLGFTLLLSLVTVLVFGMIPLWRGMKPQLQEALQESGNSQGISRRDRLLGEAVAVGEIALALILLLASSLLLRSLLQLQRVDPGFDSRNLLTAHLILPENRYSSDEKILAFQREVLKRLRALPGVQSAATVSILPLAGDSSCEGFEIDGLPAASAEEEVCAELRIVSPGYFEAMDIGRLQGQSFTDREDERAEPVVIINQAMADQFFPGHNPIDQRLTLYSVSRRIIGVVENVRHFGLEEEVLPEIYAPIFQYPVTFMVLVLRVRENPESLAQAVRRQVLEVDPDQAVYDLKPMEERLSGSIANRRVTTVLLTTFAGLALWLAVTGVYSVIGYGVRRRTREIGIRMTLGASRTEVCRLIVRRGLVLALSGISIGLTVAFFASHLIVSLLYNVSPQDPLIFSGGAMLLLLIALLASYLPGRWAAGLEPAASLRLG